MDFLSAPATPLQSSSSAFNASDSVQDLLGVTTNNLGASTIITVNSIADVVDNSDGMTTLREAINFANADTGDDVIVFDRGLFSTQQTISLSLGELDITHNLSIIAPRDSLTGEDLVTVSGNNATRVFEIGSGATVTLSGLVIADGKVTSDDGGGIKNSGTLTLDNSIVRGGSARSGGGIYNYNGRLEVSNSTLSSNTGSGIYNYNGTLEVSNSTLSSNTGGGISNSYNGRLEVSNSTLSSNSGSGIFNSGTANVSNSTISRNSNSGISNSGSYNSSRNIFNTATVNVSNSTISSNSATYGGGIYNIVSGIVTVSNSTISNNSAVNSGGGIFNDGTTLVFANPNNATVTINNSTLTLNSAANGGGVFNFAPASAVVRNTIIASNLKSEDGLNPDVAGRFISDGYNLIGDRTGSSGFTATGDIVGTSDNPIDPRLGSLDSNGGPTQTHALLEDSPAIDAGDPAVLDTDPSTDQRGFPRVSGARVDIGAFELS